MNAHLHPVFRGVLNAAVKPAPSTEGASMSTTNEVKHTPGPWRVEDHYGVVSVVWDYEYEGRKFPYGIAGNVGCGRAPSPDVDCFTSRTTHANARLIAAAPDLLAACKAAREFLEDGYPPENISPSEAAIREQLDAAIARAEGRGS